MAYNPRMYGLDTTSASSVISFEPSGAVCSTFFDLGREGKGRFLSLATREGRSAVPVDALPQRD